MEHYEYPRPILTIDIALFTLVDNRVHIALMPRPTDAVREPGLMALPGGFVHPQEDSAAEDSAVRVLRTKLGFTPNHLEQAFTESGATRDPDGWSASIVFLAVHPIELLRPLADDGRVTLYDVNDGVEALPTLAFDHKLLIEKAIERLRKKASYSSVVGHFFHQGFTMLELRTAYESLLKISLFNANFRKKIESMDLVEPWGVQATTGRPAKKYRLKDTLRYFDKQIS